LLRPGPSVELHRGVTGDGDPRRAPAGCGGGGCHQLVDERRSHARCARPVPGEWVVGPLLPTVTAVDRAAGAVRLAKSRKLRLLLMYSCSRRCRAGRLARTRRILSWTRGSRGPTVLGRIARGHPRVARLFQREPVS
jgi:hypothetical protein